MKFAASALLLIGSASAFAPSKVAKTSTALNSLNGWYVRENVVFGLYCIHTCTLILSLPRVYVAGLLMQTRSRMDFPDPSTLCLTLTLWALQRKLTSRR